MSDARCDDEQRDFDQDSFAWTGLTGPGTFSRSSASHVRLTMD